MKKTFKIFIFIFLVLFSQNIYSKISFNNFPLKLQNPFVKDIKSSPNYYWIATAAGLIRYEISNKETTIYGKAQGLPDDFITSIAVEPDEEVVWVGTPSGIGKLNTSSLKTIIFNKKNRSLGNDKVNTLLLDKNVLYVGTQLGVDKFQNNDWSHYTAIEGLAGDNIQSFALDGDRIWAGGGEGISYYDKNDDFWISYDATNGLNNPLVTSLAIDADAIWTGTLGGGISRFDKNTERFEPYTTIEGLADDYVQCLMDDGNFIWIGTFDGLSRLNKKLMIFENFNPQDGLKEPSVFAGMVYGNKLILGTDGGGLFIGDKEMPQIAFSSQKSGYKRKGQIEIYGTLLSDVDFSSLNISYKLAETTDNKWYKKGIELESPENGYDIKLATINTSTLAEGKYRLMIQAVDDKNRENLSTGVFFVDKTPPNISVFFRSPKEGEKEATVSGRYVELNLTDLIIKIGKTPVKTTIDRQKKSFRFNYPVNSMEKIFITATDIAQNSTTITKDFLIDSSPPKLTVNDVDTGDQESNIITISGTVEDENIDKVIIYPTEVEAALTPLENNVYEYTANVPVKKEGKSIFQVTAIDKAGRTTVKSKTIKFVSNITIIEVNEENIPEFTIRDKIEISGYVLGPLPQKLYLDPGNYEININEKDKSFSHVLPLARNETNKFELKVRYVNGLEETRLSKEITVGSDDIKAELDADSKSFRENLVTLSGKFDRGVTKILINDKPAKMNMNVRTFKYDINIKDGTNKIIITSIDELSRVKKKTETIYLDRQKPYLFVRPLPKQTGLKEIKFKGSASDVSGYQITAFPSAKLEFFDPVKGEFEGIVSLSEGTNRIFIMAVDKAGNKTIEDFLVEHQPIFAKIEIEAGAESQHEILALRQEVERLKQLLASGGKVTTIKSGIVKSRLPAKAGLFLVPMGGKTGSFDLAAKLYLGSEVYSDIIAGYNGKNAKNLRKILVPTPELFDLLSKSKNRGIFEKIIEKTGREYIKNQKLNNIQNNILAYFMRNHQLQDVKENKGYILYKIKNNVAVIIGSKNSIIDKKYLKKMGIKEALIARISNKGVMFQGY
ncbi:MAG: hypothetical protein OEZ22_01845 [Spirochaetia bacterium]|nr:hypothetical protein [Spirochaetia bacterium]